MIKPDLRGHWYELRVSTFENMYDQVNNNEARIKQKECIDRHLDGPDWLSQFVLSDLIEGEYDAFDTG
tara:strand:- start:169 stop:372 length:204 start_codon:yes stop_codon:yes gene_type:complete